MFRPITILACIGLTVLAGCGGSHRSHKVRASASRYTATEVRTAFAEAGVRLFNDSAGRYVPLDAKSGADLGGDVLVMPTAKAARALLRSSSPIFKAAKIWTGIRRNVVV